MLYKVVQKKKLAKTNRLYSNDHFGLQKRFVETNWFSGQTSRNSLIKSDSRYHK